MSGVYEPTQQHGRESALRLLKSSLESGQPLSRDVGSALYRVLSTLGLSEQEPWVDVPADATYEQRSDAEKWHAAGWRSAVDQYRTLLAVVRESGVSGSREGVAR